MKFSQIAKLSSFHAIVAMSFGGIVVANAETLGADALGAGASTNAQSYLPYHSIEVMQVSGSRDHLRSSQLVNHSMSTIDLVDNAIAKPTIADWLIDAPSVSLNGQGGLLQSYSIRGFSRARIRTEVDGIPIITDRRAGNSASFINSELLARIDVQQGPSATLYGSEAMGGVINLVTAELATKQLSVSSQTDDQATNAALLWGADKWQSGIAYRRANQATAADGTALDTDFTQLSALLKFSEQWQGLSLEGTSLVSHGSDIGKSSRQFPLERIVEYPNDTHVLSQLSVRKAQDWFVQLYQHYQNWDTDTLRVNSRRNLTQYQSHTLGALALSSIEGLGGQGRIGAEWLARRGVSIEESEFSLEGQQNFTQPLVDGKQDNMALFTDWHWQWQNWQLGLGARFDHVKQTQWLTSQSRDDQQISTSALLTYQINPQHKLSAEFATGFRFPTLSELYFAGETPRGTTLGNPDLAPEQSRGVQLSWQYQLSEAWQFDVVGYYYDLDNYIERFTAVGVSGESTTNTQTLETYSTFRTFRNLGRASIEGLEASIHWQPNERLSMKWLGHFQQGEEKQGIEYQGTGNQGETLTDLTPAKLSWHTLWQWRDFEFTNQLTWLKNQSEVGSGETQRPHSLLWQGSVSKTLSSQLSLSLYGNNLTNENGFTSADEDAPRYQGRVLGIKLNYLFE